MNKITVIKIVNLIAGGALILIGMACRSTDMEQNNIEEKVVTMKIDLTTDEVDELGDITPDNRTSLKAVLPIKEVPLNKDFSLAIELKPATTSVRPLVSVSLNPSAVLTSGDINRVIQFNLIVYNSDGSYNTQKLYNISSNGIVSPAVGGDLKLNGGSTYIFIAHSYNDATAGSAPITALGATTAVPVDVSKDYMFFKSAPIQVTGNNDNLLSIKLRHMFTQITVSVDATPTNGYLITRIGSISLSTRTTASMDFSSSTNTTYNISSSTASMKPVGTLSGVGTATVTANPVLLNHNTTVGNVTITGGLQVGSINRTSDIAFNDIAIMPSQRYNLRLFVRPTDKYETISGQNVVTINGKKWMRYNVGATPALIDADTGAITQSLHGNYFQWGYNNGGIASTYSNTTGNTASPWTNTPANANAWAGNGTSGGSGSTATGNPCPSGFRIPTEAEYNDLIANTTVSPVGSWQTNGTTTNVYSAALVYTSTKDKNVKIVFPAGGWVNSNGILKDRAAAASYWTSTIGATTSGPNSSSIRFFRNEVGYISNPNGTDMWRQDASLIRCIQ